MKQNEDRRIELEANEDGKNKFEAKVSIKTTMIRTHVCPIPLQPGHGFDLGLAGLDYRTSFVIITLVVDVQDK